MFLMVTLYVLFLKQNSNQLHILQRFVVKSKLQFFLFLHQPFTNSFFRMLDWAGWNILPTGWFPMYTRPGEGKTLNINFLIHLNVFISGIYIIIFLFYPTLNFSRCKNLIYVENGVSFLLQELYYSIK